MLPAEGDDHRVNQFSADNRSQFASAAQSRDPSHASGCLLRVIIQKANRLITKFGSRQHDAQERTPHIAHADNQHTSNPQTMIDADKPESNAESSRERALAISVKRRHINQHQTAGRQWLQDEEHRQHNNNRDGDAAGDQIHFFQPGAARNVPIQAIALVSSAR